MMEQKRKPEIRKQRAIIKYVMIPLFLIIALFFLRGAIQSGLRYSQVKEKGVEVQARISRIVESMDSEGMDEYEVYVDYEYRGQTYTTYYDSYGTKQKVDALGNNVTVVINPNNPGEKMSSLGDLVRAEIIGFALCLACAVSATGIRVRKMYFDCFGMSNENIRMDLLKETGSRRFGLWLLITGCGLVAGWIVFKDFVGTILAVIGVVMLYSGIRRLVRDIRDMIRVRNSKYRIQTEKLIQKYVKSDSDSDSHILVYGNSENTWEEQVSEKLYNSEELGNTVTSVFIEGGKRPVFCYVLTESGWARR